MFCQSWIDRNNRTASDGIAVAVVIEVLPLQSTSLEHHLVLCQGPRLVAEHELHLTQLLRDVESSALGALVVDSIVHESIIVYEVDLHQLGDLDGDVQGQGDDDLEDDDEGPEGEEPCPQWTIVRVVELRITEGKEWSVDRETVLEHSSSNSSSQTQRHEDDRAPDHVNVDPLLQS